MCLTLGFVPLTVNLGNDAREVSRMLSLTSVMSSVNGTEDGISITDKLVFGNSLCLTLGILGRPPSDFAVSLKISLLLTAELL